MLGSVLSQPPPGRASVAFPGGGDLTGTSCRRSATPQHGTITVLASSKMRQVTAPFGQATGRVERIATVIPAGDVAAIKSRVESYYRVAAKKYGDDGIQAGQTATARTRRSRHEAPHAAIELHFYGSRVRGRSRPCRPLSERRMRSSGTGTRSCASSSLFRKERTATSACAWLAALYGPGLPPSISSTSPCPASRK